MILRVGLAGRRAGDVGIDTAGVLRYEKVLAYFPFLHEPSKLRLLIALFIEVAFLSQHFHLCFFFLQN